MYRWLYPIFLLLFYWPTPSQAWFDGDYEIKNHYLGTENFFDLKAYQPPLSWQREWNQSPSGMMATVGSLSMERFYIFQQLRLSQPIVHNLGINYEYLEDSIYKPSPAFQEASFWYGAPWNAAIIGFPAHNKRLGHMGAALGYGQRGQPLYFRASRLSQNALYNEKNVPDYAHQVEDKYVTTPVAYRVELSWVLESIVSIQLDYSKDQSSELEIIEPKIAKTHRGSKVDLFAEWGDPRESTWGVVVKQKRDLKGHRYRRDPRLNEDQIIHFQWSEFFHQLVWAEDSTLTIGVQQGDFSSNRSQGDFENDFNHHLKTTQAFGKLQLPNDSSSEFLFSLQAGKIKKQVQEAFNEAEKENSVQVKGSAGLILFVQDQYRVYLNSTWDLDTFSGRQWDGGNLMVQFLF